MEPTADDLQQIHQSLRLQFVYASDEERHGRPEHWPTPAELLPDKWGNVVEDCDGYALAARQRVLDAFPTAQTRLVACTTEADVGHLVCLVDTGVAQWVLDNRQLCVETPEALVESGYTFHRMSSTSPGGEWVTIQTEAIP